MVYNTVELIDGSNTCGLRCPGCVHTDNARVNIFDWPNGNLSESIFRGFIERHGPFAFDLYFANYGEPLLNPLLFKFIAMARRFMLPTYASTSLSLKHIDFDALVSSGLNFLILSIDGATEKIYKIYRRKGNFELVIDNLKRLIEAKHRLNSYSPILHWQFLVFEHNAHEIETVKRLSRDLGVNQIALAKPYDVSWDDHAILVRESFKSETIIYNHNLQQYRSALDKMTSDLDTEVIGRHFHRSWSDRLDEIGGTPISQGDSRIETTAKCCTWLYKCATMDAHGRIMPCARPPSTTDNLVFAKHNDEQHFNSEKHRLARRFFSAPSRYQAEVEGLKSQDAPFCSQCTHPNTKLDISTEENVRQHLNNINLFNVLSDECKDVLTNW
jgi:MoaA/NifB/PqqE/SkfB family radical SAM enzyme